MPLLLDRGNPRRDIGHPLVTDTLILVFPLPGWLTMGSNSRISSKQLPGICLLLICYLSSSLLGCQSKPHYVDLNWTPPVSSPVPIVGYNIYRSADGDSSYHRLNSSPLKEPSYTDHLVQSGRTYRYVVRSVDNQGIESSPSVTVNVTIPE